MAELVWCAVDCSAAIWDHLHHPGHLGAHYLPAHSTGRHRWQELKGAETQGTPLFALSICNTDQSFRSVNVAIRHVRGIKDSELALWPVQAEFNAPVRTTKYPREVPPLPWYRKAPAQMLMAGFLPFSAIYIELYYIFASVWGHKVRDSLHLRTCNLHVGHAFTFSK